jgi:hypothetical protein
MTWSTDQAAECTDVVVASEGAAEYSDCVQGVVLEIIAGFSVDWDSWPMVEQALQFLVNSQVFCELPLRLHVPLIRLEAALVTPAHFSALRDGQQSGDDVQDGGAGDPLPVAQGG